MDPAVTSLQHGDNPLLDEAQLSPCIGQTFEAHPRPALYEVGVGNSDDKVIEAARQYVGLDLLDPFFWRARDGKHRPYLARGQLQRSADVPGAEGLHDALNAFVVDAVPLDQLSGHRRDVEGRDPPGGFLGCVGVGADSREHVRAQIQARPVSPGTLCSRSETLRRVPEGLGRIRAGDVQPVSYLTRKLKRPRPTHSADLERYPLLHGPC